MTDPGREIVFELDLDATVEDAWRAITEARELTRWFPLTAEVTGQTGGRMVWDWGERFHWATRIALWEPARRLRLVQEVERPHDVDGKPMEDAAIAPAVIAMDFRLETRQGRTSLRLTHSGFGTGAAWDEELEGVRNGWSFELRSLAHYLRHHFGQDRHVGWANISTGETHHAVWERMLDGDGFTLEAEQLQAGEPYRVRTPGGATLSGEIILHVPEREFVGTVTEYDNGIFRLGTWSGGGAIGINVWMAAWAEHLAPIVSSHATEAQAFLDRTFAAASA